MPFRAWCARRIALVRSLSDAVFLNLWRTQVPHPAMSPNNVAVITGGASGIGLAAAMRFAALGMKVCIADVGTDRLKEAETKLSSASPAGGANIMTAAVDILAPPAGEADDNFVTASLSRSVPTSAMQTFMPSAAKRIAAASP